MTVGQKMKYIRNLRGMTQKEVGVKAGFSAATADARIRQYEAGKMKPKADKLKQIADALGVDVCALSDIDIQSWNDVMMILFELEKDWGLSLKKAEGNYVLSFDGDKTGDHISYAMDAWYSARKHYHIGRPDASEEDIRDYQLWTQQYPITVETAEADNLHRLLDTYRMPLDVLRSTGYRIEYASDLIRIIEALADGGLSVSITEKEDNQIDAPASRVRFRLDELLSASGALTGEITRFLSAYETLSSLGMAVDLKVHSWEDVNYADFTFYTPLLVQTLDTAEKMLTAKEEKRFDEKVFQMKYRDDLQILHVKLSEYH